MKTIKCQFDDAKRVVSLDNLRAMCARASGMCHRYDVVGEYASGHRVAVSYSNPDEYGNECPLLASFPAYGAEDCRSIVLEIVRVTGGRVISETLFRQQPNQNEGSHLYQNGKCTMKTQNAVRKIAAEHASTRLERNALRWLNEYGQGYDDGAAGAWKDLEYGGCSSGLVGHLIYSADCRTFLKRHRDEINALLAETISECGCEGPAGLLRDWDASDPLGVDVNADRLAWFGFETAARNVAGKAGLLD